MCIKEIQDKCSVVNKIVDRFVNEYELDDGELSHTPSEVERFLISDAIQGLLVDDDFVKAFEEWRHLVKITHTPKELETIPQTTPVKLGTVIRVTDYPFKGLWKSTEEGWIRLDEDKINAP